MSFEGSFQILCKNGHLSLCDVYEYPIFELHKIQEDDENHVPLNYFVWRCSCGELASWYNMVDQTNRSLCPKCKDLKQTNNCKNCDNGRIDGFVDLEILKPQEDCKCDKCGNIHLGSPSTYKIPENVGKRVNINYKSGNHVIDESKDLLRHISRDNINKAREWFLEFETDLINNHLPWYTPHVVASSFDEIVIEWWNNKKKLSIYIVKDEVDYFRVDENGNVEGRLLKDIEKARELWFWLYEGK